MEYWDLVEEPIDETYRRLIKVLCDHSDKFYFITRAELKYDQEIIKKFQPHLIETYKTNEWSTTRTEGRAATKYVIEANTEACRLLQELSNSLYDWVAPNLPEDLTFIKNNFEWFACCTHEKFGGFSIRSKYYEEIILNIQGLKIVKEE